MELGLLCPGEVLVISSCPTCFTQCRWRHQGLAIQFLGPVSTMEANVTGLYKFNEQQELDTHSSHEGSQKGDKTEHLGAPNSPLQRDHQLLGLACCVWWRAPSCWSPRPTCRPWVCALCFVDTVQSRMFVWVEREVMQGSERGEAFCFLGADV